MKCSSRLTVVCGCLFLCVLSSLSVAAQNSTRRLQDSLRLVISRTEGADRLAAYRQLARTYQTELDAGALDSLLVIFDAMDAEARKMGDIVQQGLIRCNRLMAFSNRQLNDEVISQAPAVLDFLAGNELWENYYILCRLVIDTYRIQGKYEKALAEADRVYEHAKARNDRGGMGIVQLSLSRIYTLQRRFPEAEKCLRESIAMMQDETGYLNLLATAYNRLIKLLIAQRRYDEAGQVAHDTEAVNRRYEQASKSPQPSAWYNLYMCYVDLYRQSGEFEKAQVYVDKIDSMTKGTVKIYKERAHVLLGRKRYREALELLDKAIKTSSDSLESKYLKLVALIRMQEPGNAIRQLDELVDDLEAERNAEYNAKLDEVRTQYEVDKYIAEEERTRLYFLLTLGLCLFLFLLLGGVSYYNRIIAGKNRNLYRQIREQDRLEEELELLRAEVLSQRKARTAGDWAAHSAGDWTQRDLVARLREYLLSGDNLAHSELGRDEIAGALGTNKNTLTDAVKAVTGKTPMEYIRAIQLDEARRQFDKHPELTVEAVAFDCGFNAPNTFYRLFRKHYGISPAEYRKIAHSQRP